MSILASSVAFIYKCLRPIIFRFDSEYVHDRFTKAGEFLGSTNVARSVIKWTLLTENPSLKQEMRETVFENPIGLAAGFDYEARLTQILPALGFGFGTVGTITNRSYEGNPLPRLGRLVKSRSLLVNKGFKSSGIKNILN